VARHDPRKGRFLPWWVAGITWGEIAMLSSPHDENYKDMTIGPE